jgi:hypothetical protein
MCAKGSHPMQLNMITMKYEMLNKGLPLSSTSEKMGSKTVSDAPNSKN